MAYTPNSGPDASNVYLAANSDTAATVWAEQEGQRLKTMGDLVGVVAREDLGSVFSDVNARNDGQVELIDLGAGPDGDIEKYCTENGVGYTAYDGNEAFLADRRARAELEGRPVDASRTILGRLEDMAAIPDAKYDLSFSRAATAWSADPDTTIAEQLRITNDTAVYTEYDWRNSGVHGIDSDAVAAGNAAKFAMVMVLEAANFKTEFGADISERVARVAEQAGYTVTQTSVRHELPEGDHRALFIDAAETIRAQLQATGGGAAAAKARAVAERLDKYLRIVRAAPEGAITFRLPALATEIVRIVTRPEQS